MVLMVFGNVFFSEKVGRQRKIINIAWAPRPFYFACDALFWGGITRIKLNLHVRPKFHMIRNKKNYELISINNI